MKQGIVLRMSLVYETKSKGRRQEMISLYRPCCRESFEQTCLVKYGPEKGRVQRVDISGLDTLGALVNGCIIVEGHISRALKRGAILVPQNLEVRNSKHRLFRIGLPNFEGNGMAWLSLSPLSFTPSSTWTCRGTIRGSGFVHKYSFKADQGFECLRMGLDFAELQWKLAGGHWPKLKYDPARKIKR